MCKTKMAFEECVNVAKAKLKISFPLKEKQLLALESVFEKRDTLCVLPTGYGKSLIFQLVPLMLGVRDDTDRYITIVLSPLTALIQNQLQTLSQKGLPSCALDYHASTAYVMEEDEDESDAVLAASNDAPAVGEAGVLVDATVSQEEGEPSRRPNPRRRARGDQDDARRDAELVVGGDRFHGSPRFASVGTKRRAHRWQHRPGGVPDRSGAGARTK